MQIPNVMRAQSGCGWLGTKTKRKGSFSPPVYDLGSLFANLVTQCRCKVIEILFQTLRDMALVLEFSSFLRYLNNKIFNVFKYEVRCLDLPVGFSADEIT